MLQSQSQIYELYFVIQERGSRHIELHNGWDDTRITLIIRITSESICEEHRQL